MKAKEQWFAVFGDGAPFVKGVLNSLLGIGIGVLFVLAAVRLITLMIKLGVTEDEDTTILIKRSIKRNIFGFGAALISVTVAIIIINVIPKGSGDISSSWLDAYGSEKGEVQKIVNWILAIGTGIGIIFFLITTPYKVIMWMISDDEDKALRWKGVKRNLITIAVIFSVSTILLVMANVFPAPATI